MKKEGEQPTAVRHEELNTQNAHNTVYLRLCFDFILID